MSDTVPERELGSDTVSGLHAELRLRRASFDLDLRLDVPPGGVLALLGPNGSGKSTVLDCIAGLLRPKRATINLRGRPLHGLPAHERPVGLLAQDPLLFPHLNVLDNVAFGPRSRGSSRADARATATRWLAEVDALELAGRRPAHLSGGQAQRVALARALASEPELLLLDEPFASLDVDAAPAMRALLRRVLRAGDTGRTAVLVTHDVADVRELADQVLVLADGQVSERGPVHEVLGAPSTAFTARVARGRTQAPDSRVHGT